MMSFLKKYSSPLIILLLSYFSIQPLFTSGFFSMHDDTQVARVYEMKTALADGMFPVRWVPDLGYNYGYPIFNFYGPLAYYVGGVFNLLGFDALIATKIMIGLGTLLAGLSMYLLAKEFWGKIGGIVSAILYVYAPYHALNIYVRGAIGELWAYGLLPLAFYCTYKIYHTLEISNAESKSKSKIKNKNAKTQLKVQKSAWIWVCFGALSYAAIIISHNLTAMMITPFLFGFGVLLYIIARFKIRANKSFFILLSLLLGILLAAFYWVPVLFEMKYTNVVSVVGGGSDYVDHFACLSQLWESPWGFAGSSPGCIDGMSFKLGKLHIILAFLAFISLVFVRKDKRAVVVIALAIAASGVSVFFITEYSKFIWDAIPHMAFFQFPWRFLILTSFFLSFLGGAIFLSILSRFEALYPRGLAWLVAAGLVIAIIFLNAKLFVPDKIVNKNVADYTNKSQIRWETSKISDEYMPPGFRKPMGYSQVPTRKISEKKGVKFLSYNEKTQRVSAVVDVKEKTDLQVNLAYFPGWHVYIDGKQEYFKYYNRGLLVTVPKGKHTVEIAFSQTPIEQAGNGITIAGILVLLAGIIFSRKDSKRV